MKHKTRITFLEMEAKRGFSKWKNSHLIKEQQTGLLGKTKVFLEPTLRKIHTVGH